MGDTRTIEPGTEEAVQARIQVTNNVLSELVARLGGSVDIPPEV